MECNWCYDVECYGTEQWEQCCHPVMKAEDFVPELWGIRMILRCEICTKQVHFSLSYCKQNSQSLVLCFRVPIFHRTKLSGDEGHRKTVLFEHTFDACEAGNIRPTLMSLWKTVRLTAFVKRKVHICVQRIARIHVYHGNQPKYQFWCKCKGFLSPSFFISRITMYINFQAGDRGQQTDTK